MSEIYARLLKKLRLPRSLPHVNDETQNIALLPSGFADLLPPEAGREADAIAALQNVFKSFGYNRVKPPIVEFEDSLTAPGPGAALAQTMFRLMDPLSHRMMGVRSDITAQIARIASSRLKAEPRPLRVTYANDVLRTKGSQQRTQRQFAQVGCEVIGLDSAEMDIEICVLALAGLAKLGIEDVTLDISLPRVMRSVLSHLEVSKELEADVLSALDDRDVDRLAEVAGAQAEMLIALVEAAGSGEDAIKALLGTALPEEAAQQILKLSEFYKELKTALNQFGLENVSISVDPVETKGFEYHNGLAFALFSSKARGPLGRGGRYDIVFGAADEVESACGFTLYMDTVRGAMPEPEAKKVLFVSSSESWGTIKALQQEGWIVTRGAGHNNVSPDCTHIYKDGQISEV